MQELRLMTIIPVSIALVGLGCAAVTAGVILVVGVIDEMENGGTVWEDA